MARPGGTQSQAISGWLVEILIVRMHHVVWKQNQIRGDHPSSVTAVQKESSIFDEALIYLFSLALISRSSYGVLWDKPMTLYG